MFINLVFNVKKKKKKKENKSKNNFFLPGVVNLPLKVSDIVPKKKKNE